MAILDNMDRAIRKLGGAMSDVVRTRIVLLREQDCEAVCLAHGGRFGAEGIRPITACITSGLIGDGILLELEAEAVVGCGKLPAVVFE